MVTGLPLLISWETHPLISAKMKIFARLLDSFHRDRPKGRRGIPSWNLSLVLHQLRKAPFEPLKDASMKHLTFKAVFTPQPLRAVGVLFSPMVSGWAGGRREIVCLGCISETVRCRKFILGRNIGWGV